MRSGDPLASPAQQASPVDPPTEQKPAPEDETVIMRANEESRNGADDSHAKAPASRSPDESE
jgi:hypothetical protein